VSNTVPPIPAGLVWKKSPRSQGENDCLYVADDPANGGRWLRETTGGQPPTFVPESSWCAFLHAAKDGEFD
jgi:Domain of unknown function (DUF397)